MFSEVMQNKEKFFFGNLQVFADTFFRMSQRQIHEGKD